MFNGGGHGGRGKDMGKAKDFGKSIKRMLSEMKGFYVAIVFAIFLSVGGSILSVVAPDILAQITDEISAGIMIDNEKMANIFSEVMKDPMNESVIDGQTITVEDKMELAKLSNEYVNKAYESNGDNRAAIATQLYAAIDKMPESVQNLIRPQMNYEAISVLAFTMICLYLASAFLEFLEGWVMARVTSGFARNLRNRISHKINKLPLKYFDKHQIGDVLSRVTNDVDSVASSLDNSFGTIIGEGSLLLGAVVMMFWTNWILALVAIVSSLLGFIFVAIILSKSQKYFTDRQVELGNMNSHIEEVYSGIAVVKAYDGKSTADQKFDRINKKIHTANQRSQFLSGMMHPFMAFVGNFGYVAVCVTGALLTMNGAISFGIIVAFISYVRLFSSPLSRIAQAIGGLQPAAASSERVFEFIDEEEMPSERGLTAHIDKDNVRGDIEFDHVAGKTTMVNLLMKFYDIKSGDIRIDGKSTKEMTREEIHSLFTMVLQDTWMFSGTVRDNIVYNHPNVTDKEVMKVCDTVGLSHFIKTLPKGLKTEVTESDSISAGQKQLITIARGMIEDAPFLILDEATSNVDTRTEELVQKAMDKLMEGRTSFIIAHRLSTIKNADLILVMNEGNIIETGNHKELMAQGGFYADLYNSQFAL